MVRTSYWKSRLWTKRNRSPLGRPEAIALADQVPAKEFGRLHGSLARKLELQHLDRLAPGRTNQQPWRLAGQSQHAGREAGRLRSRPRSKNDDTLRPRALFGPVCVRCRPGLHGPNMVAE